MPRTPRIDGTTQDDHRESVVRFANRCQVIVADFELGGRFDARAVDAVRQAVPAVTDTPAQMLLTGIATATLDRISGALAQPASTPNRPARHWKTIRALTFIKRNLSRPDLRLALVAHAVSASPSYLDVMLKQDTGWSFRRHVRAIRASHAAMLLRTTSLSIKEVSTACGYQYVSTFDRDFERVYSRTPTAFRAQTAKLAG